MEQVGGLLILEPFGLGKVGERQLYSSSPRSLSCGYNGVSLVGCYLGIPMVALPFTLELRDQIPIGQAIE